ncbi:hypothetical protein B0H13DRAFT_1934801, partial [Mycena leptocephala]
MSPSCLHTTAPLSILSLFDSAPILRGVPVITRGTVDGRPVDRAVPSEVWKYKKRPSNRRPLPSRQRVEALVGDSGSILHSILQTILEIDFGQNRGRIESSLTAPIGISILERTKNRVKQTTAGGELQIRKKDDHTPAPQRLPFNGISTHLNSTFNIQLHSSSHTKPLAEKSNQSTSHVHSPKAQNFCP